MKLVMTFLWVGILAFALKLGVGEIVNGFAKEPSDPKAIRISVIDEPAANKLFKKFTEAKHIPFRYPLEGCYARATEMAQIAEREKIEMGKVFVEGWLQAKTESEIYEYVQWGWHVAPVVYVKNKTSDKPVLMVFDPTLFNKPVTVDEWKEKMLDRSNGFEPGIDSLYFGSKYQYKIESLEPYKDGWSMEDLLDTELALKEYLEYQARPYYIEPFNIIQEFQGVQ